MEAAAAAAAIEKEGSNSRAALSLFRSATMCVLSLLFAWLATTTLRHIPAAAGDQKKEKDQVISGAVVRGLSPLVCAYLFSLTVVLQGIITRDSAAALLRAACLVSLAAAVAWLIGPTAGAAAMFLATVHSAATLGGALAVRRQKDDTEVATAASSEPYRSRAEEWRVQWCRTVVVGTSSVVTALVMWFAPPEQHEGSNAGQAEMEPLLLLMCLVGPLLTLMRQMMLDGNPLQVETDKFVGSMLAGIFGWVVAMVVAGVVVGGNALAIVIWAGGLAMAGFFGYGGAVEAEYEKLMAFKRSEPRTPPGCWSDATRKTHVQRISTRPLVSALIVLSGPGAIV